MGFGNITNNINIHYRPNSEKINNQNFSTNSKKIFWANFHHFSSKTTFSTKSGSAHTSSYGFLTTTKIKKKQKQSNSKKMSGWTDRWMKRWTDPIS